MSESPRSVLIAFDGSDFAKAAIAEAGAQLAPNRKALLLTVFEPLEKIPFFGVGGVPVEQATMDDLYETAKKGAEKVAAEGCALAEDVGFEAEPLVVSGSPVWDVVVGVAEQRDVDLIVIGSRGLSGIKHAVLGSVAAAVAQHSRRSVLIVHHR